MTYGYGPTVVGDWNSWAAPLCRYALRLVIRAHMLNPERALEALGLRAGETFLDLGAGPGFFSLPAARVVGQLSVPLGNGVADALLLANVLHEAEDPHRFLHEAHRLLKSGGRIAVIEWKKEQTEHGPPLAHRLPTKTVEQWLQDVGFQRHGRFEPGPHHLGIVAVKP